MDSRCRLPGRRRSSEPGGGVGSAAERVGRAVGSAAIEVDGAAVGSAGALGLGRTVAVGETVAWPEPPGGRSPPPKPPATAVAAAATPTSATPPADQPALRAHAQWGLAHARHATRFGLHHQAGARHDRIDRRSGDLGGSRLRAPPERRGTDRSWRCASLRQSSAWRARSSGVGRSQGVAGWSGSNPSAAVR